MQLQLAGKTALVTGASRGIGAAIARTLGQMGADVAVNHLGDAAAAAAGRHLRLRHHQHGGGTAARRHQGDDQF